MSKKLNFAVIGAGMIGDVHIDQIKKEPRSEILSIATRTQTTLDKKLKKYPGVKGTLDYKEILNDPQIDAVVIATPPHTHSQMLQDSLAAGKHVILEKPMAITIEEAKKLVEIDQKYPDQVVLECSCRHARLQPKFRELKKMIDAGELGEIYHIHHNHLMRGTFIEYNPAGAWAHQKSLAGGGPVLDWGVYDLSFHLGLLSDTPQLVDLCCFSKNGLKKFPDPEFKSDVEEHAAAYMKFDTGLTYYYERGAGVHAEIPNETRIYGTKGSLKFANCSWDSPEIEFFTFDQDGKEVNKKIEIDCSENDDQYELTKHFVDCVLDNEKPQMTLETAAKHLNILFKIINS